MRGRDYKGREEGLGLMDVFLSVNMVMVSWVYIEVKTHPVVQCV